MTGLRVDDELVESVCHDHLILQRLIRRSQASLIEYDRTLVEVADGAAWFRCGRFTVHILEDGDESCVVVREETE